MYTWTHIDILSMRIKCSRHIIRDVCKQHLIRCKVLSDTENIPVTKTKQYIKSKITIMLKGNKPKKAIILEAAKFPW